MHRIRFKRERGISLTERQKTVLNLIAAGKTNAEIGEVLGISLDGAKMARERDSRAIGGSDA